MKRKILFIITGINQGGLETYLLRFLQCKENELTPVVLYNNCAVDRDFYKDFINTGAEMVRLPITISPIAMYKFYVFLRRENINVICDFRGDFAGISLFVSWLANIKNRIVFYRESAHQFKVSFLKKGYVSVIHFLTRKFSTKIFSNSQEALDNFYKLNSLKKKYTKVIRNGVYNENSCQDSIDVRKKHKIPNDAFVIGHVGRYTHAKNHNIIIEIANILCKEDENIYFLLCGRDISNSIGVKLRKYNLLDRVITPGLCKNIPSYLNEMNLFLFPSFNEGQPNALIEAMTEGIPIIASDIPSIRETIPKEMSEVLFKPTDALAFVNEIRKMRNGYIFYDKEKVKIWSREAYHQENRFQEFYEELL